MYGKIKTVQTEETFWAYFKGGGPVQFGSVYCVRWDICDVWYELLQEVAALLQVGGVYDHLHQLDANTGHKNDPDMLISWFLLQQNSSVKETKIKHTIEYSIA